MNPFTLRGAPLWLGTKTAKDSSATDVSDGGHDMSEDFWKTQFVIGLSIALTASPALAQETASPATPLPGFPTNSFTLDGLRLPQIFNNPTVPTDFTGLGGGLGHARGLRQQLLGPEARGVIADARMIKADPRYAFHGRWLPLGTLAMTSVRAQLTSPGRDTRVEPVTVFKAAPGIIHSDTRVMPTTNAEYSFENGQEMLLSDGAVLVKTGKNATVISSVIGGKRIPVKVAPEMVALISVMDDRLTICNFLDEEHEGCTAYLFENGGGFELNVPQARLAEIFATGPIAAANPLMALGRQAQDRQLADGRYVRMMYFDYAKAMKNYSIARALPANEFDRMLKVAAAASVAFRTQ